jgi:hypothetical protein
MVYSGLIFIHRDSLASDSNLMSFPLMPWTHGSESNEHVFGLMRSLIADFTMLDVIRMIPKLTVRLQAACRSRNQTVGDTAAGYSLTYFHDENAPLDLFSKYPSDERISSLARAAYEEACYLWSLLGYEPSDAPSLSGTQLGPRGATLDNPDDSNEDFENDAAIVSDRQELLDAIESTSILTAGHSISRADSGQLHEYTFTAAALNLQDFSDMYVHLITSDLNEAMTLYPVTRSQIQIQSYSRI